MNALKYALTSTIRKFAGNTTPVLRSLHAGSRHWHSRRSTAKTLGSVRVWFDCQPGGLRVGVSHSACQEACLQSPTLQSVANPLMAVEVCHSHLWTALKKNEPGCLNLSHAVMRFPYDSIEASVVLYAY